VAGEGDTGDSQSGSVRQDATVVTIGELDFSHVDAMHPEPAIRIVEHYWWQGVPHHQLYARLVDILRSVWNCRRVVVDATGLGTGLASFLQQALGQVVEPFVFTQASKSRLGYELLAAVNTGRLKIYTAEGSPECQEFWCQIEKARTQYRPNQTMNFFVDPSEGHDDFISSLALLVEASKYLPRVAKGRVPVASNLST
jgi:hypothetical protein